MQRPPSIALKTWHFTRARLQRLQTDATTGLLFLALAILCADVEKIPEYLAKANAQGSGAFLWHWVSKTLLSNVILAVITLLVLRISAPSGSSMTRKPLRFFVCLAIGTALGLLVAWQVGVALDYLPSFFSPDMDWMKLYSGWADSLLWGGLFGWMYFLNLRRKEDQARFGVLLGRRALLARQLAQSQIIAARAQVDPAMVVRILREVHTRYADNATAASTLMDHMIDYLRLALHRVREPRPMLARELPLLRAYLNLRAAETGRQIHLHAGQFLADRPAGAIFLVAREMVDNTMLATTSDTAIDMHISIAADHTTVDLRTAGQAGHTVHVPTV